MALEIRPAEEGDVGLILAFIRALAEYEREPNAVVATEEGLRQHLFGTKPAAHCLLAFLAGEPAGFALYFFNFSTWLGRPGLFLEDLFVHPHLRRHGVGGALLRELARVAVARDCGRMEWMALDWNTLATDFYRKLGARPLEEWTTYRMDPAIFRRLAEGVPGEMREGAR